MWRSLIITLTGPGGLDTIKEAIGSAARKAGLTPRLLLLILEWFGSGNMPKAIDLVGRRFGKLVVTGFASDADANLSNTKRLLRCLCDCGEYVDVTYHHAKGHPRSGLPVSCGTCDHAGERYGRLVVQRRILRNNKAWYECLCDCGNTTVVKLGNLRGTTKSCGCIKPEGRRNEFRKALQPGVEIGHLTLLQRANTAVPAQEALWYTQCRCGKLHTANEHWLEQRTAKTGIPHSCGCLLTSISMPKDLTGYESGYLVVLSKNAPADSTPGKKRKAYWNCLCRRCGQECVINGGELMRKDRPSTMCLPCSHEEGTDKRRVKAPGDVFGRLTFIKYGPPKSGKGWYRCVCGTEKLIANTSVITGLTTSCGCYMLELARRPKPEQSIRMTGPNNPGWRFDLTPEDRIDRRASYGKQINELRAAVFARDKFTCQACGDDSGGNLNAHHIRPWSKHTIDRFKRYNLVTLCESCHVDVHVACGGFKQDCSKHTIAWIRAKREETGYGKLKP